MSEEPRAKSAYRVKLSTRIVHRQAANFVSMTLDTSVVIGGRWWGATRGTSEGLARDRVAPLDLQQPMLSFWAQALAPAMIRMGGTEADRILYGFTHEASDSTTLLRPPHRRTKSRESPFILKGKLWDQFNRWAANCGFEVLFTVSAGPEMRDATGRWVSDGAERLIRKTVRKGYPVVAWELGNEVNAYPFLYGLWRSVGPRRYLEDFAVFADLVRRLAPGTRTVGPSSAIWPLIGEPNPIIPALGRSPVAAFLDVLSFHYYPQQSDRGRIAVRRARESTLLNARVLNGVHRWLRHARKSLSQGPAAQAPIWVTELGHALYGGQEGISDTWLSTPWWLDQLGLLSSAGVGAVFRQSLVGGDYGLLDPTTLAPRPDYWATVVWKHRMGPLVHEQPQVSGTDCKLRAWHHSWPDGRSCLVLINLHRRRSISVHVDAPVATWDLLKPSAGVSSRDVLWNGHRLETQEDLGRLRTSRANWEAPIVLPPLACAFVELSVVEADLLHIETRLKRFADGDDGHSGQA